MARLPPHELMIKAADVKKTTAPIPRLIHIILYALRITNDQFAALYTDFDKPSEKKSSVHPRLGASRAAMSNKHSATFYMFMNLLGILQYDLEDITVKIRDKNTGDIKEFSYSDTIEKLDDVTEKTHAIGIDSL